MTNTTDADRAWARKWLCDWLIPDLNRDGEKRSDALARERARIREDERQRAHDIALAIDSGRGNEKEIARAIMDHPPPSDTRME